MEWDRLIEPVFGEGSTATGSGVQPPQLGTISVVQYSALHRVLSTHTKAVQAFFALWSGYENLVRTTMPEPAVIAVSRPMLLFKGRMADAVAPLTAGPEGLFANLWWPADRSWCVATDIDLRTTYVGCRAACADSLLAEPDLEVAEVCAHDSIAATADVTNTPGSTTSPA